ncbi:hypothetical protein MHYP_G00323170 [Metynnis hypsauchen]
MYLDDIIVLGKDVSEMLQRLSQVFNRLLQANLKLKPSKCCLFRRQVAYLGHIVSAQGIATDPEKVQKVQQWPEPTCVSEVRQFVGLAAYYRRFVPDFATIAKPLHELTKKNARFRWTPECQDAFETLKSSLTTTPVLGYPCDSGDLILDTDASNFGIGAVLSQMQDGAERVLAYGSRRLSSTEQNYCTTRRELLAVVEFSRHFRQYLLGRPFIVRSDHSSLRWLVKMKEPEGQLARWLEKLAEVVGVGAHPSSRARPFETVPKADQECQTSVDSSRAVEKVYVYETTPTVLFNGWTLEDLCTAQQADPDIAPVWRWLEEGGGRPTWVDVSPLGPATKAYWSQWKRLYMRDGVLLRHFYSVDAAVFHPQIVLPRALQQDVLKQMHDGPVGGHFGVDRTLARIRTRYYWYQMREDVTLWCHTCTSCAAKARPSKKPQAPMGTVRVGAPMERIAIDLMGPMNETERHNRYILVAQDYFTKWVEAYPLPNDQAVTVAEVLMAEWVCRYRVPQTLHSDQGPNFESDVFRRMCELLGIEKTRTTPFRPQSDGQSHWLELAHRIASEALGESVKRAKKQYDKNVHHTSYNIGDAVWHLVKGTKRVRNKVRKFLPEGPYFVLGQLDDLVYRIQKNPKTKVKVVHHDKLKPYHSRTPLDTSWVHQYAEAWQPEQVLPPALEGDTVTSELDLPSLFSDKPRCDNTDYVTDSPSSTLSGPEGPDELQFSGGSTVQQGQPWTVSNPVVGPTSKRPKRNIKPPKRFGDWLDS